MREMDWDRDREIKDRQGMCWDQDRDIEMIRAEMREYRDCMLESDKRYSE